MTIWCIALSTDFLIVTSHSIAIADLPSWDISFSKLVIPFHPILISSGALTGNSLWRSNTATDAPDLAREIAVALPIPRNLPAPVITATFPLSSLLIESSFILSYFRSNYSINVLFYLTIKFFESIILFDDKYYDIYKFH